MKTSIVVTNYNYGNFVERAVRSCLHQRLVQETTEVVVVDDASTDHSRLALDGFRGHPQVRLLVNDRNLGVAAAANAGIRAARGQYVVRVDADDFVSEWFVFFLQTYLEMNHEAIGVACDYSLIDAAENTVRRCHADAEPISCGILYRRDALVAAGLYNPDFRHCEEMELRRRMGEDYAVHHLRMPLYRYRKHGGNKTEHPDYAAVRSSFHADVSVGSE
jgi:glycosyltransferase involved in cell wall biosynthesis